MKKIIKLILIGLIAGGFYKYMVEREINIAEKSEAALEWIKDKLNSLEDVSIQNDPGVTSSNISENPVHYDYPDDNYSLQEYTGREVNDVRPGNASQNDNTHIDNTSSNHITDAVEYKIMYKNRGSNLVLEDMDKYAIETPANVENSIDKLVKYLIRPASNDMEKARLIFTWVASNIAYDDHGFNTGDYSGCSALEVLENRVSVCEGYSNLLVALGNAAGIKTVKIDGYTKGITYKPGDRIRDTNHAWNAMLINGTWRLFDVTWAAAYGTAVNGRLVSVRQFDDYWFNTAPEEFIFTHLPEDKKWQLLDTPIDRTFFEKMPYASSDYFKLGFNGKQCFEGVLNGDFKTLPVAYSIDNKLQVISMPVKGIVESGHSIKLRLRAENADMVALKNNGEWVYFEKENDGFILVTTLVPGQMKVMANFRNDNLPYHTVLKYTVN